MTNSIAGMRIFLFQQESYRHAYLSGGTPHIAQQYLQLHTDDLKVVS